MALSFCGRRIVLGKSLLSKRFQHGYVVLLPEFGEDIYAEKNPLFRTDGLPEFSNITIDNYRAVIAKQTLDLEQGVEKVEEKLVEKPCEDIFKEVFQPLEVLGSALDVTWGLSKTLYLGNSTLMSTTSYMAIHERARRARAAKFNNKEIYKVVKAELGKDKQRSNEENRILQKFALEGRLNGLDLIKDKESLFGMLLNNLAKEKAMFKEKIDVSNKLFTHTIRDFNIVREFPETLLKSISQSPVYLNGPWTVTLNPQVYSAVMQHCPDRETRWNLWQAFISRGSSYMEEQLATGAHLQEIRYIRQDMAKLLGYNSFADMSMETKMAGSLDEVNRILNVLLRTAKAAQDEELNDLYQFATDRGFKFKTLELWDIPYWRRKQQKSMFDYDEANFKEYFPFPNVLNGLYQLCERLFNIVIKRRRNVSTWHKDVQFYDIFDDKSSAPIASFYLDPYARSEDQIKNQSGGWMVAIQNQSRIADRKPLAALIFDFERPTKETQSHLTFKEVTRLFYKFGQALQHLLTQTNYSDVAGSSNVEWDAVEVSGYVLSHWLQNKTVLDSISSFKGDKIPDEKFQALLDSQRHMAGLDLSHELYLSALDLELHKSKDYWLDIMKRLWPVYNCSTLHKKTYSQPCAFTEIFIEEWGAAYYSHVWARMIAADVYSAFYEIQGDEQLVADMGKRFRDTFLGLGGSVHPSQIFREFRGRDPSPKALISSLGLKRFERQS